MARKGKKSKSILVTIIFLIVVVISLFLLYKYGLFQQNFLIDTSFTVEENSSFNNINLLVKSTKDFGENISTIKFQESDDSYTISLDNKIKDFGIFLSASHRINGRSGGGGPIPDVKTFIITKNLSITNQNLNSLKISWDQSNSISCGDNAGVAGDRSAIYLINSIREILLFESERSDTGVGMSSNTQSKSSLELFKDKDKYVLDISGNKKDVDFKEGDFEIAIYASIPSNKCGERGGSLTQNLAITSLNINYTIKEDTNETQPINQTVINTNVSSNQTANNQTVINQSNTNVSSNQTTSPPDDKPKDNNLIYILIFSSLGVVVIGLIIFFLAKKR